MKALPLYEHIPPKLAVQTEPARAPNPACTRCYLHKSAQNPCLEYDGGDATNGGDGNVLFVGESPGRNEDVAKRPFVGASGQLLRRLVAEHWKGGAVYDNALRCAPGKTQIKDVAVEACRGYLATTLDEARWDRIVTLGAWSAYSVTGRAVSPFGTRRGYTYIRHQGRLVPVFFVLHPAAGLRNRFVRKWFEEDLKWALTARPEMPAFDGVYHMVTSPSEARMALARMKAAEWASFDVESCGLLFDPSFELLSTAHTARGEDETYVIDKKALANPGIRHELRRYLADEDAKKTGSNIKFDVVASHTALDVWTEGVVLDVRLVRKLLEPEASGALENMVELVGLGGMKDENADAKNDGVKEVQRLLSAETRSRSKGRPIHYNLAAEMGVNEALEPLMRDKRVKKGAWAYALVPTDVLSRYNARDALGTAVLGEFLEAKLEGEPVLKRTWERIVRPASNAISRVEAWGLPVEKGAVEAFDEFLGIRETELHNDLSQFAPPGINWDSHEQLRELLFKKLRLPVVRLTDNEEDPLPSTAKDVLEVLKDKHPVIPPLIEFRKVRTLRKTFAKGLLRHIRPDGRIHPSILLDGARSGRTSCKDPNLQNQPRPEDPLSKMVRDLFVARPGYRLVQLDYSQLELRVAAMLSGDLAMKAIFESGVDYHMRTAQLISRVAWGIKPEDCTKAHRSFAKTINFGLLYGKGDKTIAEEFKCSRGEAAAIRAAILGTFKRLDAWSKEKLIEARKTGKVWTWWDGEPARWRPLWRVADADDYTRSVAEHGAVNSPVQGTASDFCIVSLAQTVDWLLRTPEMPAVLCLPIHDALLFEVREDCVYDLVREVRRIMTSHNANGIPIVVDADEGQSWGSMKSVELPEDAKAA